MKTWMLVAALTVFAGAAWAKIPVSGDMLVSREEASRPDAAPPHLRGLFPGPAIKLEIPDEETMARPLVSPFHLKFQFQPRNAAKVDLSSVKLVYLKQPSADLTPRILSGISSRGIDLAHVSLPPGKHSFLISVDDTNGNRGAATYTLVVAK